MRANRKRKVSDLRQIFCPIINNFAPLPGVISDCAWNKTRTLVVPALEDFGLSKNSSHGESIRSQGSTSGEARTACCVDAFSNRAVHLRGGVRRARTMDQGSKFGGLGLLQPAGSSDFNVASSRHRHSRLATPTGGSKAEGHLADAPRIRLSLHCDDLVCLVGSSPRAMVQGILTELSIGCGVPWNWNSRAHWTPGRVFKWREWTGLDEIAPSMFLGIKLARWQLSTQNAGNTKDRCHTKNKTLSIRDCTTSTMTALTVVDSWSAWHGRVQVWFGR